MFSGYFGVIFWDCRIFWARVFFQYFSWKFRVGPSRSSVAGRGVLKSALQTFARRCSVFLTFGELFESTVAPPHDAKNGTDAHPLSAENSPSLKGPESPFLKLKGPFMRLEGYFL